MSDFDSLSENVVFVLKVSHESNANGRIHQHILQQTDLIHYQKENKIDKNFCRKEAKIQMKFSCYPCRKVLESVDALNCHLQGKKHRENETNPPDDLNDFEIINGKWKKRAFNGGVKRKHGGNDLSKRERTKRNKTERNMEILPQHTHEKFNEAVTYFEPAYRKVRPYYFTFVAHAKGRWVGRSLWDVFSKEFRAIPKDLFQTFVDKGFIKVNKETVSSDYKVQNNDFISHTVHRHELPVTSARIKIVHEDEDTLVVDKPPSIPVHPCGRYRHNTVIFILAKEQGYKDLHTVHRLDRLTSGILMFAKSAAKSRELEALISGRQVRKEYVCRVNGEFPADREIVVDQPILVVSYKIGVCIISPEEGKPSKTVFKRVAYKDGVSVVACKPETGRMHQIRVHLQYLGFPISNDPLYNSDIFGPQKGKDGQIGKTKEQLIADLIEKHTIDNWIQSEEYENSRLKEEHDSETQQDFEAMNENEDIDKKIVISDATSESKEDSVDTDDESNIEKSKAKFNDDSKNEILKDKGTSDSKLTESSKESEIDQEESHLKEPNCDKAISENEVASENHDKATIVSINDESKTTANGNSTDYDELCLDCQRKYKDPPQDTLLIYLHAMKYSGEGWEYRTDPPSWANL
eukprot:TRINITY_DN3449_c0_g1_i4.p1 TRINITY_DN3449_c0_g1~~TRINITY_DN3449_c0_g1_i4.p1  ORF type:complete len:635 (+),score=125.16 TRINITY_DN3449_c0_g1_i4:124-2028(+)